MKKIFISLLLVFALSSAVFAESFDIPTEFIRIGYIKTPGIFDNLFLVYDNQTKIVYLQSEGAKEFTISPYYSPNGKLCKYDETSKKLVEVE